MGHVEPFYAHLPLLFGTDGRKLSKRHGATSLSEFRDDGFLPDAVFNYLAILGWSLDAETTVFSREQAIEAFELTDVSKSPAVFDLEKLTWMNGEYVRAMGSKEFNRLVRPDIERSVGRPLSNHEWESFEEIAPLVQERTKLLPEAGDQVTFLFNDIDEYDEKSWSKVMARGGVAAVLEEGLARMSALEVWDAETIEATLREMPESLGIGAGKAFQPLRVAVTGSSISPPLFESISTLGRERTLERIGRARRKLG
jgi:glutamyl-tRNA synthetase